MMDGREDSIGKIDPSHLEGFDSSDVKALESLYSAVLSLKTADELHRFFTYCFHGLPPVSFRF